jgi:Rad3-related DNA helicase
MNYATVTVPSTFPVTNRPIFLYPVAAVTHKAKDTAYPDVAAAVAKVIAKHPRERILVHTVSYDLAKYLADHLSVHRARLVTYTNSQDKAKAVETYLANPASVMLAPSLDRGVDFRDDDCRVIVVAKIPFPHLGDKQISAKLYSPGGQQWYAVKTVRTLVQMTGRGMRSETDACHTYLLDSQFINIIWRRYRQLLPTWWSEALVFQCPPL